MTGPGRDAAARPVGRAALGLAIAALAACWNPLAAPFGLVVGIATTFLAIRALRRSGGARRVPAAALACSVLAIVASAATLVLTAGAVGLDLPGEPVVKARNQAELDAALSEAGERTRPQRERARRELDAVTAPAARGSARDGGAPPAGTAPR